eukprot:6491428-Amphidinium_carterae.1
MTWSTPRDETTLSHYRDHDAQASKHATTIKGQLGSQKSTLSPCRCGMCSFMSLPSSMPEPRSRVRVFATRRWLFLLAEALELSCVHGTRGTRSSTIATQRRNAVAISIKAILRQTSKMEAKGVWSISARLASDDQLVYGTAQTKKR